MNQGKYSVVILEPQTINASEQFLLPKLRILISIRIIFWIGISIQNIYLKVKIQKQILLIHKSI